MKIKEELVEIQHELRSAADSRKAVVLQRFFKTGKGEYAEGDRFLGVVVPEIRRIMRGHQNLDESSMLALVRSPFHEERLCGLLILVEKAKRADPEEKLRLRSVYLSETKYINNWDLVDLTAEYVVGPTIDPDCPDILVRLAGSDSLWERRIAMLSTFSFIKTGNPGPAIRIAEILKDDSHDLIRKAVGWMLREVGKRCSLKDETDFLDKYAGTLPRTTLRYAIERFSPDLRRKYMRVS